VGEIGVTKCNESIYQGGVFAPYYAGKDKIIVKDTFGGEKLSIGQLPLQEVKELVPAAEEVAVAAQDMEGSEKVGMDAVADRQAVSAINSEIQAVKDLHDLEEKVTLRRIADGKVDPRFAAVVICFNIEIQPVVPVPHVKNIQNLGDTQWRGIAYVSLVVDPEDVQQAVEGI